MLEGRRFALRGSNVFRDARRSARRAEGLRTTTAGYHFALWASLCARLASFRFAMKGRSEVRRSFANPPRAECSAAHCGRSGVYIRARLPFRASPIQFQFGRFCACAPANGHGSLPFASLTMRSPDFASFLNENKFELRRPLAGAQAQKRRHQRAIKKRPKALRGAICARRRRTAQAFLVRNVRR